MMKRRGTMHIPPFEFKALTRIEIKNLKKELSEPPKISILDTHFIDEIDRHINNIKKMELQIGNKKILYQSGRATGKKALLERLILEKEIARQKGDDISNSKGFK